MNSERTVLRISIGWKAEGIPVVYTWTEGEILHKQLQKPSAISQGTLLKYLFFDEVKRKTSSPHGLLLIFQGKERWFTGLRSTGVRRECQRIALWSQVPPSILYSRG